MVAAYILCEDHELTVFEGNSYLGGHTHTFRATVEGRQYDVDTGFAVFNEQHYPNLTNIFKMLDVRTQPADLGFAIECRKSGIEYDAAAVTSMLKHPRNFLRPSVLRMWRDVQQFQRDAKAFLTNKDRTTPMKAFLDAQAYAEAFHQNYLKPMLAAIWTADPAKADEFPARRLLHFLDSYGFLDEKDPPAWRSIRGGAYHYIERLVRPYQSRIRLKTPVKSIRRFPDRVVLTFDGGRTETFDEVIIATHSNQALALLEDPSDAEHDILASMPYAKTEVVLHTDDAMLPERRGLLRCWNCRMPEDKKKPPVMTYNLSLLHGLSSPQPLCLTLKHFDNIDRSKGLCRFLYELPMGTWKALAVQSRHRDISGVNRTHYCGAYWGQGLHEDGAKSAMAVGRCFGKNLQV